MNLKPGLYRHYKGNDYYVFQIAHHSETREALVVYQCLYGDYSWWVRPLAMFIETVELGGETIQRFQFMRELSIADAAELVKEKFTQERSSV